MKSLINFTVLMVAILLPLHSHAADQYQAPSKEQVGVKPLPMALVPYVPPKPIRPIPKIRTSQGGTRGCGGFPVVTLLAPEHVGLTTQAQPQLYWHTSAMSQKPAVVTLSHHAAVEPLLEWHLPAPIDPGIHVIDIAKHGIHLQVGKTYEWSLRINCGAEGGAAGDLVVKSYIERIAADEAARLMAQRDDPLTVANAHASSGIWYDALTTLHVAWGNNPGDHTLQSAWSGMLEQVELTQPY
ncbi:MAG: DUF928 domain-containing protein [Gammaproteobacteria bacterium]|nr:DUF928 domain-containing protein [Gammaproteobacteria bacterium]